MQSQSLEYFNQFKGLLVYSFNLVVDVTPSDDVRQAEGLEQRGGGRSGERDTSIRDDALAVCRPGRGLDEGPVAA